MSSTRKWYVSRKKNSKILEWIFEKMKFLLTHSLADSKMMVDIAGECILYTLISYWLLGFNTVKLNIDFFLFLQRCWNILGSRIIICISCKSAWHPLQEKEVMFFIFYKKMKWCYDILFLFIGWIFLNMLLVMLPNSLLFLDVGNRIISGIWR